MLSRSKHKIYTCEYMKNLNIFIYCKFIKRLDLPFLWLLCVGIRPLIGRDCCTLFDFVYPAYT